MREVFERAGIRFTEAAVLLGVSRATLYSWMRGKPYCNQKMFDDALKCLERIRNAVEEKKLPIVGVAARERLSVLKNILAKS